MIHILRKLKKRQAKLSVQKVESHKKILGIWKRKFVQTQDPPTALLDHEGNLVTSEERLKK